jgi:hypothetical protein
MESKVLSQAPSLRPETALPTTVDSLASSSSHSAGWTNERVELLKQLWADGLSASQIATRLRDEPQRRYWQGPSLGARRPRDHLSRQDCPPALEHRAFPAAVPAGAVYQLYPPMEAAVSNNEDSPVAWNKSPDVLWQHIQGFV